MPRVKLPSGLVLIKNGLAVTRDIALLVLAVLAIYIAYRDYLKTDVQMTITAPAAGSVVLNKEISIEGTISGGPYNGYEVHDKAPEDEQGRLICAVQESGEQIAAPVFPIPLSLMDKGGAPRIGQHTITVTLKAGKRVVEQESVSFDVLDCSLVMPREFVADKPIHEVIDLKRDEEIQGYDLLYYIDGLQLTLDCLNPAYLEDGYHQLRIAAVVRGCEDEVDSVTTNFVVDNTAPIIESLGLSEGAHVSARSRLVPKICDPHLDELQLFVDDELVGKVGGQALKQRLDAGDLGFTLEGGWRVGDVDSESPIYAPEAWMEERKLKDGWHDLLIKAYDVNALCSMDSARVWVDSTRPGLRWDVPGDAAISVLPTDEFWLGAMSPDSEAEIAYSVKAPATIVEGEYLDTSECELGSVHVVLATAKDSADNTEAQVAYFAVERSSQAWLNTRWRSVTHGITTAMTPISDALDELSSEGMSIGVGAEVSSSLADDSVLMWKGVFDFGFIEMCPMFGRGSNQNTTIGLGFRVPLEFAGLATSDLATLLIHPVLDFGTAVTPNWNVLDSLDFGTEKIAETWVKLSLSTVIFIPLSTKTGAALKLDVAPGCKLSFVQEFKRELEFLSGGDPVVRKFVENSLKLEVTIDGSIAFSVRGQR